MNGVILSVDGGVHASNGQPNFLSLLGAGLRREQQKRMNLRLNLFTLWPLLGLSGLLTIICAPQTNEPVTIISHVEIIPDAYKAKSVENAAKLFRSQAAATKQDAGLNSFVFLQQNG